MSGISRFEAVACDTYILHYHEPMTVYRGGKYYEKQE